MSEENNDKYKFETYWNERKGTLMQLLPVHLVEILKSEMELTWNRSKAMANEEILEVNVVVNRGIWEAMMKNNKDAEVIYQENNNE